MENPTPPPKNLCAQILQEAEIEDLATPHFENGGPVNTKT